MKINEILDAVNNKGEDKIIFMVYEDRINLTLNYSHRTNEEQLLKLYTFLKFYLKQMEKQLDLTFESMYFPDEEEENVNGKD